MTLRDSSRMRDHTSVGVSSEDGKAAPLDGNSVRSECAKRRGETIVATRRYAVNRSGGVDASGKGNLYSRPFFSAVFRIIADEDLHEAHVSTEPAEAPQQARIPHPH